ncbi:MAG: type II toxin-antitoxin system RelE/ParE family toxin [Candidatus Azobacteroides sp.]|nr:type II toxin-antitoxin system RelE/ParE family toxin [Candidatus Azobacteroides sp.]
MASISTNYKLIITNSAQEDIDLYIDTIIYTYDAPITAKKHYDDLYNVFRKIEQCPMSNPIRYNSSFLQYGYNVRRVNYKKMAILYTVNGNNIYVHRVIAGSLITEL